MAVIDTFTIGGCPLYTEEELEELKKDPGTRLGKKGRKSKDEMLYTNGRQ